MNLPFALRLEARADPVDASLWYEQQSPGLSDKFHERLEESLKAIAERPGSFPLMDKRTRRALVKQFPYAIYFREQQDHILVTAILHTSRSPKIWRRRNRD